jgi:hypothetical protein
MRYLVYILFIFVSCSRNSYDTELSLDNWVEKQYLFSITIDSSSLYIDDVEFRYCIHCDTLIFWHKEDSTYKSENDLLPPEIIDTNKYLINYYAGDSLILRSVNSDPQQFYDSVLRLYPMEFLIDSTIKLNSIIFKYGIPLSNYVSEAFFLSEDKMFVRMDTGSFRISHDFCISNGFNKYKQVQNKIRLIDLELMDTIFPCTEYHSYYIVQIHFNDTLKTFKGCDLAPIFRDIRNDLFGFAYRSDEKYSCDQTDEEWLKLIEPEEDIIFNNDR